MYMSAGALAAELFEERYKLNASNVNSSHRTNNLTLHRIINYLERPQQSSPTRRFSGSRASGFPAGSGGGGGAPLSQDEDAANVNCAHAAGAAAAWTDLSVTSSTAGDGATARACRGGGGIARGTRGWLRRLRGGEQAVGLAAAASSELELSAMAPGDHFHSGAISPAESNEEIATVR